MAEDKTELYILKGLIHMPDYAAKYIDKMEEAYFSPAVGRVVRGIKRVWMSHKKCPTNKLLIDVILPKVCKGDEVACEESIDMLQESEFCSLPKGCEEFYDWLVDETKKFIKRSRIELALVKCVELMDQQKMDAAIQEIINANNISFDESLGLDYLDDIEKRMDELRNPTAVIDTGIDKLNRAIGGGWRNKSLTIFGAATNVGKTLILGDISFRLIDQGLNGLYLTLEITENLLANRIDANMSGIPMKDLSYDVDELAERIIRKRRERESLSQEDNSVKPYGRLIIKEYPPATMNSNMLLSLVRELELKRGGFKPDFICVDYIGLMTPNGKSFSDNTYGKLKTVSEELRAIAVKLDLPIFSAVQVNRDGYNSSHVGLENTADSIGIPATADLMITVCRDSEADSSNKMYWYVAKSRFSRNGDQFMLDVDYDHMRVYDAAEDSMEDDTMDEINRVVDSLRERKLNGPKKQTSEAESDVGNNDVPSDSDKKKEE